MDDLRQWLGEQLDEDERIARDAGGKYESGQRWWEDERFGSDGTVGDERGSVVVYRTGVGRQHSAHIARHDPARVLREIDAKRQLLDEHKPGRPKGRPNMERHCLTCTTAQAWDETANEANCLTLRLLALPYAGRAGYDEGWRP